LQDKARAPDCGYALVWTSRLWSKARSCSLGVSWPVKGPGHTLSNKTMVIGAAHVGFTHQGLKNYSSLGHYDGLCVEPLPL
jgi:hypothetical protein